MNWSKLDCLGQRVDKLIQNRYKLNVSRKRNKGVKFNVKQGMYTFIVTFEQKPFCNMCGNNTCDHIFFILYNTLKLSDITITYLTQPKVYDFFVKELGNPGVKRLNGLIERFIIDHLKGTDCGICLECLTDQKYSIDLFQCNKCKKFVHTECITTWFKKCRRCVYCNSKDHSTQDLTNLIC